MGKRADFTLRKIVIEGAQKEKCSGRRHLKRRGRLYFCVKTFCGDFFFLEIEVIVRTVFVEKEVDV